MNENNKTSNFLSAINKYAQQQRDEILLEVEQFKKQEIEKATKQGLNDAYALFQKEYNVRRTQITSQLATRELNSRKALFKKRSELVDKVFSDAKEKLLIYTNTSKYTDALLKSAEEISTQTNNSKCVIKLKHSDSDKADAIKKILPDCDITFDSNIEIGGMIAICDEKNIIIDETIDTKLSDEKQNFIENCGLKVV